MSGVLFIAGAREKGECGKYDAGNGGSERLHDVSVESGGSDVCHIPTRLTTGMRGHMDAFSCDAGMSRR